MSTSIGSARAAELEEIGLEEALADGALLVEWPELLPAGFAENRLDIRLDMRRRRAVARRSQGSAPGRRGSTRTSRIRAFLEQAGWPDAARVPLAGDASARAYERISRAGDDGGADERAGAAGRPADLCRPLL